MFQTMQRTDIEYTVPEALMDACTHMVHTPIKMWHISFRPKVAS